MCVCVCRCGGRGFPWGTLPGGSVSAPGHSFLGTLAQPDGRAVSFWRRFLGDLPEPWAVCGGVFFGPRSISAPDGGGALFLGSPASFLGGFFLGSLFQFWGNLPFGGLPNLRIPSLGTLS